MPEEVVNNILIVLCCCVIDLYTTGWAIAVPGLDKKQICPDLLNSSYVYLRKHDLLLQVQPKVMSGKDDMCIHTQQHNARGVLESTRTKFNVGSTQKGKSLRGFARLVVMAMNNKVQQARSPKVYFCQKHQRVAATHASTTGAVCPLLCDDGNYLLLYGAGVDDFCQDCGEGESETPLASIYLLLEEHFAREIQSTSEVSQTNDGWWEGGPMQKLSNANWHASLMTLRDNVSSRLNANQKLLYVYDFIRCDATYNQLRFVLNAGRPPLEEHDDTDFQNIYGIPRILQFQDHQPRSALPSNWWAAVY